ncbi:hypothetical protein cyc_01376 [Cyclospora cayetanensis]|uniref:Uncharacterized protein n=1 Tax=Cyclospora cayetanensis TaxID=88456 RepID=A0A1D3CXW1_9EIME|nr:hypothetical protein cyc_01376 [Cyclospora cayetanensis]
MAGRTLSPLVPKEYVPGLMDEGGLPVRVRHIFARYQNYMEDARGASYQTFASRSSMPLAQTQGHPSGYGLRQERHISATVPSWVSPPQTSSPLTALSSVPRTPYPLEATELNRGAEAIVDEGHCLLTEAYTGVMEAGKEQEFALVLLSRSLPASSLFVCVDRDILCKAFLVGRTLRATIPPLDPGRHSVTITNSQGETYFVQVGGLPGNSTENSETQSLPLVVVAYPPSRKQPRLCYSAKGMRRSFEGPFSGAGACGPYTPAELEEFVAATERQMWGPNKPVVPFSNALRSDVKKGKKAQSFDDRLRKCLQMAYGQRTALTRPAESVPSFVPDDLSECRIPLAFKASLYASCQPSTRMAIASFHSQMFEFMPFGVVSAHIFMKSHPSDKITIFAFTITPPDSKSRTVPVCSEPPNVASLDRFEASERLCADTRHWRHVDTSVPRKNAEAAAYVFGTSGDSQCPVPQSLRYSKHPHKEYPEGIEIAPYVFLYFEPWPVADLPIPEPKLPKMKSEGVHGQSPAPKSVPGGTATVKPLGTTAADDCAADEGPYFSVTLCVGKYIFSSVIGVHRRVLSAIFNDWLKEVPHKKEAEQQLVRMKLKDVVKPILNGASLAGKAF